ncbi:lysis protein [Candidatus Arsenophonus triatominarum]|uniref:lysis protein n=1 Tax=Candidatus Arsenophonus triatominarum TaxID=57911 RepID=UPI0007C5A225
MATLLIYRSDYCRVNSLTYFYQLPLSNHQAKLPNIKQQYRAQIEAVKLQQQKIDSLHQLDIQHTEKLNNAKAEIAKLNDAVRAGTKQLHVNAVCPIPKTATTQSRHNEATPQLSKAAREDYFRLRAMIAENEKQTEYLQQYIKTQCH